MKPSVVEPSAEPLSPEQRFAAYRRMLASLRDEDVHWWYFGTTLVSIEGMPPIPVINATTLMIYRTETLSADRFAIHWDEVGYFADCVTGERTESWLNPLTGRRMPAPQGFAEGPARYEVTRTGHDIAVTLTQPGARVNSINVTWCAEGERLWLVQQERKTRGFPEVDGKLPDPSSASGFEAVTNLAFMDDRAGTGADARGLYSFALAGAPPWMGFDAALRARATVHGVILKASPASAPRKESLQVLKEMFPEFFSRHP
jgi:hypothetical protein